MEALRLAEWPPRMRGGTPTPLGTWGEVVWNVEDRGWELRQLLDSIGVTAKFVTPIGLRGWFWVDWVIGDGLVVTGLPRMNGLPG